MMIDLDKLTARFMESNGQGDLWPKSAKHECRPDELYVKFFADDNCEENMDVSKSWYWGTCSLLDVGGTK